MCVLSKIQNFETKTNALRSRHLIFPIITIHNYSTECLVAHPFSFRLKFNMRKHNFKQNLENKRKFSRTSASGYFILRDEIIPLPDKKIIQHGCPVKDAQYCSSSQPSRHLLFPISLTITNIL